jgi:EmrB/QacA subfamily drug resistance transporter
MSRIPLAVLVAAVLGTALAYMSDDMLNLAIPSVAHDLGATMTDVQWLLGAYYVPLVALVLIVGSIGDIVGHRRVFIVGLLAFAAGAVLCAMSPGIAWLSLGRAVQGVAAAMLVTAGLALVTRLTPAERRDGAIGLFLGLIAAVPAVGPFISGALVDLLSWRWLFLVPLVLPGLALIVTWTRIPETATDPTRRPDLPGAATAVVCLGGLSVALILASAGDLGWPLIAAALIAIIAGVAFVFIEQRSSDPMLPLELFRRPVFVGGNLAWLLGGMTCWSAVLLVALALQTTLGLRPALAGLTLVPIYLVMMIGSPLAGRVAERIGHAAPILVGLAVYALGLWALSELDASSPVVPDVVVGILVLAVGMAMFTAPLASATFGSLDEADQGIASGVNNAMSQLAGLLAIVLLPLVSGLGGVRLGDPAFAVGYAAGLRAMALVAVGSLVLAAVTFGRAARRDVPVGSTAPASF